VDFERLFQRGDLSHNISLQPDDYLYFAPASANEIYVLGEVMMRACRFSPPIPVRSAPLLLAAIHFAGIQESVLVVRGSLDHPQTFVVDTAAILAGKAAGLQTANRATLCTLSRNPWVAAAELVDMAVLKHLSSRPVVTATTRYIR